MDVLNVHVFAAICIGAHQASFVGNAGLDVVHSGGLGCLLQRGGGHVGVGRLLHAVY